MTKLSDYQDAFFSIPTTVRRDAIFFTLSFLLGILLLSIGLAWSYKTTMMPILEWPAWSFYALLSINTYVMAEIFVRIVSVKWRATYFMVHGKYFSQNYD